MPVRIDQVGPGSVVAVEFRVLGPVEVVDDQGTVSPVSMMRRRLLAVLLVHAGEAVSVDHLVDLLWPGGPPAGAVASLHAHVSRLRATLAGIRTGVLPKLVTCPTGYLLRVGAGQLDAARFGHLIQQAGVGTDPHAVVDLLDEALGLWRGPAYGQFADEHFAAPEVARLTELRLGSIEHRAEALLALGRHAELVAPLERFTAEYPLRERPHAALMLALYRCDRLADALAVYRTLRQRLVTELGLEPSVRLQRLQVDLLAQRVELAASPAVASLSAWQLPEPVTSFLGRERDVDSITAALREARLLTLLGVGGVGKTRLALAVAAALAPNYPDGTRLCQLAPIADPDAVAPAVATALQITHRAGMTAEDSIVATLRSRHMLLVLDNCEHVIDAAGRLAQRMVTGCAQVTVLATSRQPLAIDGEHRWPVEPLPLPETNGDPGPAVQLFNDRATAIDPAFDPEAEAVAEICRRLDGIPLAIELAAARIPALGPEELARRLDQRFRLLTAGPRTTQRHRTLTALVDWSYDLLSDTEQTVFDRLSVFAGSFTLSAAEDVCAGDGIDRMDVAGLVAELADRSLIVVNRSGLGSRYRLLETLRHYGANQLSERDNPIATQHRFIAHYLDFAERAEPGLRGPDEAHWVAILDRELDNLRAVHHRALDISDLDAAVRLPVALHYYAYFRLRTEIASWAERALALPQAHNHPLLAPLYGTAAGGAAHRGDLTRARRLADHGLQAATEPEGAMRPLETHAGLALYEGRLDDCLSYARRILQISEPAGEHYHTAFGSLHQALACSYRGDHASAQSYANAVQRSAEAAGNPTQLAWAAYAHGETLADEDPERAIAHLEEAITRADAVRNALIAGVARVSISALRSRHGSTSAALRSFRDVIDHWQHLGDWTHQWTTLRNLTELLTRIRADQAAAVLHAALTHRCTGARAFGASEHRLAAVAATLANRLSPEKFAAATRHGMALTDDEVVTFARTNINHALCR